MVRKRCITIVLLCLLIMQISSLVYADNINVLDVSDINEHWAEKILQEWIDKEFIHGYTKGKYAPDRVITRAEFITLVNTAFDFQLTSKNDNFTDVKVSNWFYEEVGTAKEMGYITGYTDKSFKPNKGITREEAAVILNNLVGSDKNENSSMKTQFNDSAEFAQWSRYSIKYLNYYEIINGYPDGQFKPKKFITRAEAVIMLDKLYKLLKVNIGIKGLVLRDGKFVEDAKVHVFNKDERRILAEIITDKNGMFEIKLNKGEYDVSIISETGVAFQSHIDINEKTTTLVEVELKEGVEISGILKDEKGNILKDKKVCFTTNPTFTTTTDEKGVFKIKLLPNRTYVIGQILESGSIETIKKEFKIGNVNKDYGDVCTENSNNIGSNRKSSNDGSEEHENNGFKVISIE